jgi:FAD/FMN-containing dehydrogenase
MRAINPITTSPKSIFLSYRRRRNPSGLPGLARVSLRMSKGPPWRGEDMDHTSRRELLKALEGRFGGRCKPHGKHAGPLTVLPADAGEVGVLAEIARRYSVALRPVGAGLDPDLPEPAGEAVLVGTELMRAIRFPDAGRGRVEAEPGALWLELEGKLRSSHRALTVYPTSAPRATVGGWLARDGLGVGSFGYGWLRENVLSAELSSPTAGCVPSKAKTSASLWELWGGPA